LFLIAVGITIAFIGIQIFFTLLPILGFVTGFFVGAVGVEAILGDGFLGTVTGWVAGAVVGVLFAAVAWYWWYAGVLVSAGASGALIATALAEAIGVSSGWALFLFGAIGVAIVVFISFAINLPIYIVIVNTAIVGASVFINGVMLLFNQVDHGELDDGLAVATVQASWWWVLAWAVVAAVGIGRQLALKDRIRVPSDRWTQGSTARI
jgi:hypothetical protein